MSHNINKVNSVEPNREGNISQNSDDIVVARNGTNYTAANTDSITTHLAGIDTALAGVGGSLGGMSFDGLIAGDLVGYGASDIQANPQKLFFNMNGTTGAYATGIQLPDASTLPAGTVFHVMTWLVANRSQYEIYPPSGQVLYDLGFVAVNYPNTIVLPTRDSKVYRFMSDGVSKWYRIDH